MSTNTLVLDKRTRTRTNKPKKKYKQTPEYRQKTKRIVVTDDVYNELMSRGKFGMTFSDTVFSLLHPDSEIKRSRYRKCK